MPHNLLIRLKNNTPSFSLDWLIFFADGETQLGNSDDKDWLKWVETAEKIIVLVPGVDVLLTRVKLPRLSPARLVKAIPFALEEQLAVDASLLHFAVWSEDSNEPLSVAAVSRDKMIAWQSFLRQKLKKGYENIKAFIPDVLALSWQPHSFHVLIDQDIALVKTGRYSGLSIEKEELFTLMQLILKRPDEIQPDVIVISNTTTGKALTESQAMILGIPIQELSLVANPLSSMKDVFTTSSQPNLLQNDFALTPKKITNQRMVWGAFIIMCVWFSFLTLYDIAYYFILYREKIAINNEMQQIYASVYPNQAIPTDLKASIQNDLDKLRVTHSDSLFLNLINRIQPVFSKFSASGVTVTVVSYRNNQFILQVQANDSHTLDQFRSALLLNNLKVEMSNEQRSATGLIETHFTIAEMI